ncbi:PA14 domain-containing protein, partial [Paenibacillus riograndensis]|uniref:PA14 domain-containing protein n=1 Tax=Paenibacillus riograndensis TaxID=483937 RepID=UPI000585387D
TAPQPVKPTAAPEQSPDDGMVIIPTVNGLQGEYFKNMTLSGTPVLVRNDAVVNFNWRQAAPVSSLGVDSFSIRWTGLIKPSYSETYTISTTSDDGIRV